MSQFYYIFSVFSATTYLVHGAELPSVASVASQKPEDARWWAQVGDRVFYSPPASFLDLSQNISDYYYTMGSASALKGDVRKHLVGSEGRWHILHLPQGTSMLQLSHTSGDRRSALSQLQRLRHGLVLSTGFPPYPVSSEYKHPLDAEGQALEKAGVAMLTPDSVMANLKEITAFPTRSYQDAAATDKVDKFLKRKFEDMGLTACYHNFNNAGSQMTNVIAHIPGASTTDAIIVGAHYDSRPFDGQAPGAEDNGSGLATMLAMAQAFTKSKAKPQKSIYFAAFAGEEPGLIGSAHFADELKAGGQGLPDGCRPASAEGSSFAQLHRNYQGKVLRRTQLDSDAPIRHRAIILDEVGWKSPKLLKTTVNLESYDSSDPVMRELRQSTQTHNGDKMDVIHNGAPFGSDHMSFLNNGMKAVLTINGDDEAYPHYHQKTDTIENVDPEMMAMIGKMNLGATYRLAMA